MKYLFIFISIFLFFGCFGKPNFMGANKIISGGTITERWYLNPEYNKEDIPKGTAFYGASADKIKDKFIIKYYQTTKDEKDDIEIPKKDIWTIKHNGKRFNYQDDDNLFYYNKINNQFVKHIDSYRNKPEAINDDEKILAVKQCYENGWCKLYPNIYEELDIYVKQSILDKPLSEE